MEKLEYLFLQDNEILPYSASLALKQNKAWPNLKKVMWEKHGCE